MDSTEIPLKKKYRGPAHRSRFKTKPHAGNTNGILKRKKHPHLCTGSGSGISRRVR